MPLATGQTSRNRNWKLPSNNIFEIPKLKDSRVISVHHSTIKVFAFLIPILNLQKSLKDNIKKKKLQFRNSNK